MYNISMRDEELIEKTLDSKCIYDGKIVHLMLDDIELPNGNKAKREYITHPGGAAILAFDDENNIFLVRQYRYAYHEVLWEIPAGKLEKGEDPLCSAARELEEEIGMKAKSIEPYGIVYPSPGYTGENLYIYKATGLVKTAMHLDDDEFLNVYKVPFEKAVEMVMSGEIKDSKTCYAILKYKSSN